MNSMKIIEMFSLPARLHACEFGVHYRATSAPRCTRRALPSLDSNDKSFVGAFMHEALGCALAPILLSVFARAMSSGLRLG